MTTTVAVRGVSRGDRLPALPIALAVLLVLTAIAYPLTSGAGRDAVTWTIVVLGAGLSVSHAGLSRGATAGLRLLLLVAGTAVAFEAIGLATGFPYGRYHYGAALGPTVLGVPFLVPLAWLMMAWPSWILADRLTRQVRSSRRNAARVVLAAAVFAGWDVVLDPQLVQARYWTWSHPSPALPGIPTVPLTNL
ncbi:MAG: carotenoid biosynthesis protein, partial [Blastococcus sp.]